VVAATPLWVPLVVAALGLVGTIAGTIVGVLITQRRADLRESTTRNRERERERERWAREDAVRTFDHRRDAYTDVYESLGDMAREARDHGLGLRADQELSEWERPTFKKLERLRVYATPAVADAASVACTTAWRWGHETTYGQLDEIYYRRRDEYNKAEVVLLAAIRRDLAIPDNEVAPG
jgi:hypothetical protein